MEEGCLRWSLHLSSRILAVSHMYSSSQAMWLHWKLQMTPALLLSWSFGFISTCLIVVLPLKCTCIPYLPQMCMKLSASPFVYGITYCPTVELDLVVVVVVLVPWLLLVGVWLLLSLIWVGCPGLLLELLPVFCRLM